MWKKDYEDAEKVTKASLYELYNADAKDNLYTPWVGDKLPKSPKVEPNPWVDEYNHTVIPWGPTDKGLQDILDKLKKAQKPVEKKEVEVEKKKAKKPRKPRKKKVIQAPVDSDPRDFDREV